MAPDIQSNPTASGTPAWRTGLYIVGLVFVFLIGVRGLGDGFSLVGEEAAQAFIAATTNPLIGLMVGLLATTLVQSSSATTSMIVALVAAENNALPVANAVPMIMGANIGTTVTNTIVSLAHIGRRDEFRRAFAVATCHDFFNYLTVLVLLPLEMATGYLRTAAEAASGWVSKFGGVDYDSPIKDAIKAATAPVKGAAAALFETDAARGAAISLISAALIFLALLSLVRVLRTAMGERAAGTLEKALGGSGVLAILIGALVTMAVQSSSITTSLLVPLAGAGLITLEQAFPVTLGANLGTTITALLASLAVSGHNAGFGVTIALVHVLFNLTGTLLVYPIPAIRRIPLACASGLAKVAERSRSVAIVYVVILFYGLPALFAFLNE